MNLMDIPKAGDPILQAAAKPVTDFGSKSLSGMTPFFRTPNLVNLRTNGDKTENYAAYNECLKKVNSNAQLLYKAKQNKHVLYMNGKSIEDTEVAAEEISKMIDSLATRSARQPLPIRLCQLDSPQAALGTDANRLGSVFKSA